MNIKEFERRLLRLAEELPEAANALKRKAALAADQGVVVATPVDSGRARSNWIVGLGAGPTETVPPRSPQETIDEGRARISHSLPGQDIYISNNVEYIGELNRGHSRQAPANFIQRAAAQARALVAGARILKR